MTWELASQILAALASFISGVVWLMSANVKYPQGVTYLSGAPEDVVKLMKDQARLNKFAALTAGVAGLAASAALVFHYFGK